MDSQNHNGVLERPQRCSIVKQKTNNNGQEDRDMDNVSQVQHLFNSVQEKLQHEIHTLQEALNKIDRYSDCPGDQWVYPVYERIIERRKRLLSYLSA